MILVFDTETTGFPKKGADPLTEPEKWPRIVQLAWAVMEGETGVSIGNHIVKPDGYTIPSGAAEVHGITTEMAKRLGTPIDQVIDQFLLSLDGVDTIISHNMEFDWGCLTAELVRLGRLKDLPELKKICTMESVTDICKIPGKKGYKWPKLMELHTHLFGNGFDGAHDALNDVLACSRCYVELSKRGAICK